MTKSLWFYLKNIFIYQVAATEGFATERNLSSPDAPIENILTIRRSQTWILFYA